MSSAPATVPNAEAEARRIVEDLGYPLATPARTREMLALQA